MKCAICESSYRKGTMVLVAHGPSDFKRTRVCPRCARGTIAILPIKSVACKCGKRAKVCATCARGREKRAAKPLDVTAIAKQLRMRALAFKRSPTKDTEAAAFMAGRVEATEDAATFIESGKWGGL